MLDRQLYASQTITVSKNGVALFDVECEILVEYTLDVGEIDWQPLSFHFDRPGTAFGKRTFVDIHKTEPLWAVLDKAINDRAIIDAIRDHLNNQ